MKAKVVRFSLVDPKGQRRKHPDAAQRERPLRRKIGLARRLRLRTEIARRRFA
jgi:hypothetical protein